VSVAARQWEGWGTALKPAHEPIVVARKPLDGTIIANVTKWGTGCINVDRCRVEPTGERLGGGGEKRATFENLEGWHRPWMSNQEHAARHAEKVAENVDHATDLGRWPPNVLLSEEAAAALDEQAGPRTSGDYPTRRLTDKFRNVFGAFRSMETGGRPGSTGGASRFFPVFRYEPKASRAERDAGLESMPLLTGGYLTDREDGSAGTNSPRAGAGRTSGGHNFHPTVKPIALMEWLCRLATPPDGLILDPFAGTGTTGIAALRSGFRFVGIEIDPTYCELARKRIGGDMPLLNL
jgi:site-specific DNA-methyltransferase (adenine-specific)